MQQAWDDHLLYFYYTFHAEVRHHHLNTCEIRLSVLTKPKLKQKKKTQPTQILPLLAFSPSVDI